jgi:hypothetical protein
MVAEHYLLDRLINLTKLPRIARPNQMIAEHLTEVGGVAIDLNVNGGSTVVEFEYVAPRDVALSHVALATADPLAAIQEDGFFSVPALTKGLILTCRSADNVVLQSFGTDVAPIRRHVQFGLLFNGESHMPGASPNGASGFACEFPLMRAGSMLHLLEGERFVITVQDDISGLPAFEGTMNGQFL